MAIYAERSPDLSRLRRELTRLDAVCFLIAAIVVLDTLGAVSRGGAETLTWLLVAGALFFVPAGLVVAELGSAFPQEGGPYVWTRRAFGRRAGALVAVAYWVEAAVWLGGSLAITTVAVIDRLVVPVDGRWRIVVALGFVFAATVLAIVPVRVGRRVPAVGAAAQIALLTFFTGTVIVYAVRHGVHGIGPSDLAPSWTTFVVVAPVLVYNFLGFELPSMAAGEMRDPQRDVPFAIARAGALTCVLYCLPIVAIVIVLPSDRITGLTGFIDALAGVFTVYGAAAPVIGALAGAAFAWVLLANGVTWIIGSARAQATACLDGAGPRTLAAIDERTGTPVRATLAAGAVATTTALAGFAVAEGDNAKYFGVMLTLSIALLALGNAFVFPALVQLRRSHPHVARPFRVPGGTLGAATASVLATAWVVVALVASLWPGIGSSDADAQLPTGFAGDRVGFVMVELVPLVALVLAALAFAALGRRGSHSTTTEKESAR